MNSNGKLRSILTILAIVTLVIVLGLTVAARQAHAWVPQAHPEWNGLRLKGPRPEQYLIDRGCRRWIPDIATRNRLFRDDRYQTIDVEQICLGQPISANAILARVQGTQAVFLLDAGVKRWITSPEVMDKYGFDFDKVQEVSLQIFLDYIPSGEPIF